MRSMARSSGAIMPSPHPLFAAPSFLFFSLLLLLLLFISSWDTAAADHQSDDGTWPLQRPTLSISLALEVFKEFKGNPFDFFPRRPRHEQSQAKGNAQRWGKCTYTVSIKTSCSSPRLTRDAVSLAFGDAYHNEVYAARLDDPASGTFERCSLDTFRIVGPCGGRTCYLYLRRSGRDGWTPEYVKVFYSPDDSRAAVTFFYKVPLPDGVWYGFNLCHDDTAMVSNVTALPAAAAVNVTDNSSDVVDGRPATSTKGTPR